MEKHLAIATWDADSVELYAQQVRNFLGEHIQISTYSVQGGTIDQIAPADVYLKIGRASCRERVLRCV